MAILFFQEPDRSHMFATTKDVDTKDKETKEKHKFETEPLIVHGDLPRNESGETELTGSASASTTSNEANKEEPIWKNAAVMITLWLYFVLKLVLEMLLSSTSTVTKYYFGWDSRLSGLFMAFMAMLMFPCNFFLAKLSQTFEDRELIVWALVLMLVSVVGILDYNADDYFVIQYIVFAIGIFLSTNSLEGPNMGLLSKTIPKSWAKGTFNSGFLATEAGTLARSVGDVLISFVAGTLGLGMVLNGMFVPMALLVGISLLLVRKFFNQLTDMDDDTDDDTASIASMDTAGSLRGITLVSDKKHVTFGGEKD